MPQVVGHSTPSFKLNYYNSFYCSTVQSFLGAQWLSGRVFDSRPRGCGFEPHRRHCVVVLEQDTYYTSLILVQPRKTRPCLTERLLLGRNELNQTKKKKKRSKAFVRACVHAHSIGLCHRWWTTLRRCSSHYYTLIKLYFDKIAKPNLPTLNNFK